jgi:hypothetical protein
VASDLDHDDRTINGVSDYVFTNVLEYVLRLIAVTPKVQQQTINGNSPFDRLVLFS